MESNGVIEKQRNQAANLEVGEEVFVDVPHGILNRVPTTTN